MGSRGCPPGRSRRSPPSCPPAKSDPRGAAGGGPWGAPKKCSRAPPCGAKPRGGGGAPPTVLILLRNQWVLSCASRPPPPQPLAGHKRPERPGSRLPRGASVSARSPTPLASPRVATLRAQKKKARRDQRSLRSRGHLRAFFFRARTVALDRLVHHPSEVRCAVAQRIQRSA